MIDRRTIMKTMLTALILFLLTFVYPVISSVIETAQEYSCTGEPHHLEFQYAMKNPDCDQYWSVQDHSIGTLLESMPECHSPCKELSAGKIVLTDCVNITLAVICTKDSGISESRVHFNAVMVPQQLHDPENRARFGAFLAVGCFLLALLLCAGLLYKKKNISCCLSILFMDSGNIWKNKEPVLHVLQVVNVPQD